MNNINAKNKVGEETMNGSIIQKQAKGSNEAGIASLLGSTASILGGTVTREEEEKHKEVLKSEDIDLYKNAFNDFDHNKDGYISTKELIFAFRRA